MLHKNYSTGYLVIPHNVQGTKFWLPAQLKNSQQKLVMFSISLSFPFLIPPLSSWVVERKIKNKQTSVQNFSEFSGEESKITPHKIAT